METTYQVTSIFPTPIYTNEVPNQLIQDHIEHLNNEKICNYDKNTDNLSGKVSIDTYLFNNSKYKNLSKYILAHSVNYLNKYTSYNYPDYKFSQSWISVKHPKQTHHAHFHSNSLISGVLFFGESEKNTPNLYFERDFYWKHHYNSHLRKPLEKQNNFTFETYEIFYKPNLLVLFPSHLIHAVGENTTNISRKSLAFNVISKDGFGIKEGLNELKFN